MALGHQFSPDSNTMAPGKVPVKRDPRAWDALTPPLAEWVLDAVSSMGFKQMTPVQAATMPQFLGNKDVVVEVSFLALFIVRLLSFIILTPLLAS